MSNDYWHKQTKDKPLFPDLLWSKPENRAHAGKLLIIGGNGYEFKAPANAYGDALNTGIGTAKVLLPSSMQKTVQNIFPEAEFAPSTPSGSFAENSLAQMLDLATWSDAVLLAGNFGKNSETTILIGKFISKYKGQAILVDDAIDFFTHSRNNLLDRGETTLVPSFAQLQKLAASAGIALTSKISLLQLIDRLHELTSKTKANLAFSHESQIVVAVGGKISTTPVEDISLAQLAASTSVWLAQNPSQAFAAINCASFELL